MNFKAFVDQYHKLNQKIYLRLSFGFLALGILMIILGAVTSVGGIILFGFFLFLLFFIFLIIAAIKGTNTMKQRERLIMSDAWEALIHSTKSLKDLKLIKEDEISEYENGPLMNQLGSKATSRTKIYAFSFQESILYFLNYTHTTSTGERSSTYTDFKGFYHQAPLDSEGVLLIKKDLPQLFKNVKNAFTNEKDTDGSEKFIIEGSYPKYALEIISEFEALGFKDFQVQLRNGLFEIAIHEFKPFPNVKKDVALTMKLHQDYLLKIKTIFEAIEKIKTHLKDNLTA